ncbi:discoidin domain-containing receptor 2-like [Schistocerca serialis cubense]|uniref:discoidin domain-containing receptor 2-like n=1 Tax=Schistocerca serialis cubense TaxID=2023355 RepID=UPI00214E363B|nr:discoidin domain-containing receptor 2-like [Schistocerca serialis cubense]
MTEIVLNQKTSPASSGRCHVALGMEEGRIPDSAVSASSSYEPKSVGPQNARIRQEKNGGAWCPKAQISSEVQEFLEVDLGRPHLITATETQGRFGNGQGQEYAESFHLLYWRDALQRWAVYKDAQGRKVLAGNRNTYLAVRQQLELPFVASRVRFMPYSQHTRTVCMRVELYGCPWTQSVLSYSAPRGDRWSPELRLEDLSYDGGLDGRGVTAAGLGQLVDGRLASDGGGGGGGAQPWRPDWRWVGWHNESRHGQPVELELQLDGARELTAARLHALHRPDHGVQRSMLFGLYLLRVFGPCIPADAGVQHWNPAPAVAAPVRAGATLAHYDLGVRLFSTELGFRRSGQVFSEVSVYLSLDGRHYQAALTRRVAPPPGEPAVNVSISLQQRVARFLRLHLRFADQWMLLSEVSLDSVAVPRNVSEQMLEQMFFQQDNALQEPESQDSQTAAVETSHARKEVTKATSAAGAQQAYVGLVGGLLATALLLALAAAAVLVVRRGRQKVALLAAKPCGGFSPAGGGCAAAAAAALPRGAAGGGVSMRGLQLSTPPVLARVLGVAGHARVAAAAPRRASPAPHAAVCSLYGGRGDDSASGSGSNGDDSENSSVYHEPYKLLSAQHEYGCLLAPSKSHDFADFPSASVSSFQEEAARFAGGATGQPENYYAATDIVKSGRCEQHLRPGCFTTLRLPGAEPPADGLHLLEYPRHRLRLVEKVGEGSFGMVLLCEADGAPELNGLTSSHKKRLVLVKSLWRGCSQQTREEFLRECGWLSSLQDSNVCRTLAVCSAEEPLCALQEHGDLGALPSVLREHTPDSISSSLGPAHSYGCLIYLATQIAAGMKYLEGLKLVHRDLAARNCVVGPDFSLKVSDHAMFCSRYDLDYYLSDTQTKLPVRWMSWESVLLGEYSTKSDVWAFGVTLWETLTLCAVQPLAELSDQQVVENCSRWQLDDGRQRCPARPAACPRELFDLMAECWRRDAALRPRFAEIHLFLQRKNLGYGPSPAPG